MFLMKLMNWGVRERDGDRTALHFSLVAGFSLESPDILCVFVLRFHYIPP
jgi:hypothetical protein